MTAKIPYRTDGAPPSRGTHTQAIRAGDLLFVNQQTGRDPHTEALAHGIEAQTRLTLANVTAILAAADCTPADLVKITLLLADIKDFKAVDDIYVQWLPPREQVPYPTRTAFAALDLPAGALVAIDAVAFIPTA